MIFKSNVTNYRTRYLLSRQEKIKKCRKTEQNGDIAQNNAILPKKMPFGQNL